MDLAYVAHSSRCALLLDSEGICRWVVPKVAPDDPKGSEVVSAARRCIGAQYVATLDPEAEGLLRHEPHVGKTLLFAKVSNGRVALVRFGPLVQFESLDEDARTSAAPERAVTETSSSDRSSEGSSEQKSAEQESSEHLEELSAKDVEPVEAADAGESVTAEGSSADEKKEEKNEDAKDRQEIVELTGLSSPALASFLDDVEEIAKASYSQTGARGVSAAAGDESEIELTTGSFGPVSAPIGGVLGASWDLAETRVVDPKDVVQDEDSAEEIDITDAVVEAEDAAPTAVATQADLEEQRPRRPSGFVIRAPIVGAPAPDRETMRALDSTDDDEGETTSRFARAAGATNTPSEPSEKDVATIRAPARRLPPPRIAP